MAKEQPAHLHPAPCDYTQQERPPADSVCSLLFSDRSISARLPVDFFRENSDGKRVMNSWEFHCQGWEAASTATRNNSEFRNGATKTNAFPNERKGRLARGASRVRENWKPRSRWCRSAPPCSTADVSAAEGQGFFFPVSSHFSRVSVTI